MLSNNSLDLLEMGTGQYAPTLKDGCRCSMEAICLDDSCVKATVLDKINLLTEANAQAEEKGKMNEL